MDKVTVRFEKITEIPRPNGDVEYVREDVSGTVEGYVHDGYMARAIVRSGPDLHDIAVGDLVVFHIPISSY